MTDLAKRYPNARKEYVSETCAHCAKAFSIRACELAQRKRNNKLQNVYCGPQCARLSQRGRKTGKLGMISAYLKKIGA